MKNKINVAELLKDCPEGMELDCTIWDSEAKVFLKRVLNDDDFVYPIEVTVKYNNIEYLKSFNKYGAYNDLPYCKCVIFPKGKNSWEGFQRPFKDGDILSYQCAGLKNRTIYIYKHHHTMNTSYYVALSGDDLELMVSRKEGCALNGYNTTARFATEEEKGKLFDAIKAKGYRWDAETKTLEKLIKSKEDTNDKVVMAGIYFDSEYYADEVELHLGNYEIKVRDGKTYAVRKQLEYPKTYEECCKVLGCKADDFFTNFGYNGCDVEVSDYEDKIDDLLQNFRKLRYCRDAYWKIAGEQMGLGKPWEPSKNDNVYCIFRLKGEIVKDNFVFCDSLILEFPTEEMRDAFYENFKDLIEKCKELL